MSNSQKLDQVTSMAETRTPDLTKSLQAEDVNNQPETTVPDAYELTCVDITNKRCKALEED